MGTEKELTEALMEGAEEDSVAMEGAACPVPLPHIGTIVLGHGSGGRMTRQLIEGTFYPPFENEALLRGDDAAVLPNEGEGRLALSTDSHIVTPLFFPGGDIGRLAVSGTVNDLAMVGARPQWLTASFIMEEGFPLEELERIVASMRDTSEESGVRIVAGDTKVTERGKGDGVFITTTGAGWVPTGRSPSGSHARPGDVILCSGDLGDHGIAVLAARGELAFETQLQSDVQPLNGLTEAMWAADDRIRVLRDPTRGGVATALNEIAEQSGVCLTIDETTLPVKPAVEAACEMLGFDPLYVANEGKLLAIVDPGAADPILAAMRSHPAGRQAVAIGTVDREPEGRVLLQTRIGGTRVVDVLAGELLPRIC